MTKKETVTAIADRAKELAATMEARDAAFDREATAEATVIRHILDLVRPVLPSLCQPLPSAPEGTRGVQLNFGPPHDRLTLLEDGTICARDEERRLVPLAVADVILSWDPEDIAAHLAMLMDRQIQGLRTATKNAAANAAKLAAIATLLGDQD